MTFALAARRVFSVCCHSLHSFSRYASDALSSAFLMGSSMMIRLAGLPVMPDIMPRLIILPQPLASSNSFVVQMLPLSMPNSFVPNCSIFSMFFRPNRLAVSSL